MLNRFLLLSRKCDPQLAALDHWKQKTNLRVVEVLLRRQLPRVLPASGRGAQLSLWALWSFIESQIGSGAIEPLRNLSALLDYWNKCSRPAHSAELEGSDRKGLDSTEGEFCQQLKMLLKPLETETDEFWDHWLRCRVSWLSSNDWRPWVDFIRFDWIRNNGQKRQSEMVIKRSRRSEKHRETKNIFFRWESSRGRRGWSQGLREPFGSRSGVRTKTIQILALT